MNIDKLKLDVINLRNEIDVDCEYIIKKHFEKRFGSIVPNIRMVMANSGNIELYDQYFIEGLVINNDFVMFNLCRYDSSVYEGWFERLTKTGIQDYDELVHILRNYP